MAELFARQLGFSSEVQQALRFQWERWDGRGLAYGLKGPHIPVTARILHLVQVIELTYHFGDASSTNTLLREKRGTRFDPEVVDAFLHLTQQSDFWQTFDQLTSESIMYMRPPTQADQSWERQIVRICEALADFVDLKIRGTWHHSRAVAEVALGVGRCLGLGKEALIKLQCAALVHDIGKVAIPINILAKEERRSSHEWETYRLHPYYTQRILDQVASLQDLASVAAAHHEWVNGQGYHRQLCGEQIPFHGRILAVADTYTRLIEQQGAQKDPEEALRQMSSLVDVQLDKACYEGLVQSITGKEGGAIHLSLAPRKTGPLTERECEVLRLLAQGQTTPQIGRNLGISKKTVEHHLEHIYNKIGVTCRTAAVVYAVQQGLV